MSTVTFPPDESTFEVGRKRTYPPIPIPEVVRSLLEFCNPSKFKEMSDEQMAKHIMENRKKIESVAPWPCLYWYAYLPHSRVSIRFAAYPKVYDRVLNDLKQDRSRKVLDMGGLIGHDIRNLIQDGVKPDQVVCADLLPKLFEFGLDLYGDSYDDKHLKGSQWKQVDIFNKEMVESIRISKGYHAIYASKFVHLFSREKQKEAVKTLISLLGKESGSTFFGADSGRKEGEEGVYDMRASMKLGSVKDEKKKEDRRPNELFHHSCSSFRKLIQEVEQEEGIEGAFNVETELRSFDPPKGDGEFAVDPKYTVALSNSISWALTRK